jgi:hypothetical protein
MPTTISLFNNKKTYKNETYPSEDVAGANFPKPIDFWYEKIFYGRVDERGDAVYISSDEPRSSDRLKQLHGDRPQIALNFVVDAFLAFKRDFDKAKAFRRINLESRISDLEVENAYVNVNSIYEPYIQSVIDIFNNTFLANKDRNESVETFDDYLKQFMEFYSIHGNLLPMTKTAFIKSQYCTPLVSGLVLELINRDHNDDKEKEVWLEDPNYSFYSRTARKYGFLVDKNAPWRLVANVTSPRMKTFMDPVIPIDYPAGAEEAFENLPGGLGEDAVDTAMAAAFPAIKNLKESYAKVLENYGASSVGKLFELYYRKTYLSDIEDLQKKLVTMYENFYNQKPSFRKIKVDRCHGEEITTKMWSDADKLGLRIVNRQEVPSLQDIRKSYPQSYWNKIYFQIRLREENISMKKIKFDKTVELANVLFSSEGNNKVDKNKYLWYLNEAVKGFPKIVSPKKLADDASETVASVDSASVYTDESLEETVGSSGTGLMGGTTMDSGKY